MANILCVAIFCVLLQHSHSQTCGSTSCKCDWTDPVTKTSVTFDLSTAFDTYPYFINGAKMSTPPASDYKYAFTPCTTIQCGITGGTLTPSNMCQESIKSPGTQYNAGASPFTWTVLNSTYATIKFQSITGTSTRVTTVTVVRSSSVSQAAASLVGDTAQPSGGISPYTFTITLPISGGGGGTSSASGDASGFVGFILISIIIVAVIAYFVAGAIIMAKVKGAQGSEIIPNIGFWKDLPFLIKDGVLFAFSPCCGQRFSYTKM